MLTRRDLLTSTLALPALHGPFAGAITRGAEGSNASNRFLKGNFAPVRDQATVLAPRVIGRLPEGMRGVFVRNGPNPLYPPEPYHWFDGDGMVHGVWVEDGRAVYANRFVMTSGLRRELEAGHSLFGGILVEGEDKNTANTSILWHHGRLLALMEAGAPYELSPRDLSTPSATGYTFGDQWPAPLTAHPKIDASSGELVGFCYEPNPETPRAHYVVFDGSGNLRHYATLPLPNPVMMHDFAMTERHTLFLDLPGLLRLREGLVYEPKLGARIGVLPRFGASSEIRWLEIDPCFVFHVLNAYESDGKIVLDMCRYTTMPLISPHTAKDAEARLARYVIDLASGSVTWDHLSERAVEFPRTADPVQGRKHRYGYFALANNGGSFGGFLKIDFETGREQAHWHGRGRYGGEPVFVARPGATAEDDGWLVTYVHDVERKQSDFVVVDARDLAGAPLARVELPMRIPYGFHGAWIPDVSHGFAG